MYLNNLELINFRNYKSVKLNFKNSTILIEGDNGQGKTNLLESIHYISSGKSHRTSDQDELINWDSDYAILRASLSSKQLIEIELRKKNNIKIRIDGVYYRRKSDFASMIPSVIFSPDDLRLIKAGPSNRRDFLDDILEKLQNKYAAQRLHYQKILNQRNSLIKSMINGEQANGNSTMEAWDENLVHYGSEIIEKRCNLLASIREKFVKYMNYFFPGIQADIFYIFSWDRSIQGASINLDNPINLQTGTILQSGTIKDIFNIKLKQGFKKDLLLKTTLVGPHRDDLLITINGKDIRSFGSQGQQRIAAICFKFGELEVLREMLNKNPILLLDDVLSELDPERKKLLVNIIGDSSQTFITTSNLVSLSDIGEKFIDKLLVKDDRIFF
ncbi:MAG: DNA replication/repair protein RecF [Actinobacteria bacterium]|nr:DNA replication/repair protein RecF [Actinomycetota bacterium]